MRPHQYVKNLLVFVPQLTAHQYTRHDILVELIAFIGFSLCASAGYIINDIADRDADRRHRIKRKRPFASGALRVRDGLLALPVLLLPAFAAGLSVSGRLAGILAIYLVLSVAYTLYFRRKLMVDVILLATLYAIRVVAGCVALDVAPSEWLLAFSIFIFLSLALVKRVSDLALLGEGDAVEDFGRNYSRSDRSILEALSAVSGFNAVTVFALYISSPAVVALYRRPEILWLICPILLYWVARVIVLAHRRRILGDPIVFALRDPASMLAGLATIGLVFGAT